MLNIHVRHFMAVAESLNITIAADRLNISQPSVSRSIKIVENDLGVPLIERKKRGVRLTGYGRVLYRHLCAMSQELDYVTHEIDRLRKGKALTVKVGTGLLGLIKLLPPVVAQFDYRTASDVRFEIVSGYSQYLYDELLAGRLDLMLGDIDSLIKYPHFIYKKILDVNFTIFAYRNHPLFTGKDEITEESIRNFNFAIYRHSRQELNTIVHDTRRYNPIEENRIALITTSIENLLTTLSKSALVTSLPLQLEDYCRGYDVYEISKIFRCSAFASGAVYRKNSTHRNEIEVLVDSIYNQDDNTN